MNLISANTGFGIEILAGSDGSTSIDYDTIGFGLTGKPLNNTRGGVSGRAMMGTHNKIQ
jgi:hypothetical protein